MFARLVEHPWPAHHARHGYGVALFRAGRHQEALAAFNSALAGLDTGPLHLGRGAALLTLDRREAAAGALEAAVYRTPALEDAWSNLLLIAPASERPAVLERAARWLPPDAVERLRTRFDAPARGSRQPNTPPNAS
jgi:hypothetical protein